MIYRTIYHNLIMEHLFVYGSLQKNMHNNYLLDNALYIDKYITTDTYYMIGKVSVNQSDEFEDGRTFNYPPSKTFIHPYITTTHITNCIPINIHGELYKITPEILNILDTHEGHPNVYTRKMINITNNTNTLNVNCYILENNYIIQDIKSNINKQYIPINNGDWKKVKNT